MAVKFGNIDHTKTFKRQLLLSPTPNPSANEDVPTISDHPIETNQLEQPNEERIDEHITTPPTNDKPKEGEPAVRQRLRNRETIAKPARFR